MLLKKLHTTLFLYLSSAIVLQANLPELSSINPIEFDEVSQKLVASNEATFEYKDIRLKADEITFYKKYNLINARGRINFVSNNHRLLSDDFSLDVESQNFFISNIRYGVWPYLITAKNGGGNEENINFNQGVLYYGDPHPLSPNLKARNLTIINTDNDKKIIFDRVLLRIGEVPLFYLPRIKYNLEHNPYRVSTKIGHENDYGSYFRTVTLFPINAWLRMGFNLDYYSERGALYGPAIQYHSQGENHWISGAISSGSINDKGETGIDIANQPIDKKRDFLLARHKQIHGNQLFFTLQTNDLSDSEVTRDFKETIYNQNQFPLNFFEATYITNNYGFGTFVHFENDNFSKTRERLPEINLTFFPNTIFGSSVNHYGNISYSEIKEATLDKSFFSSLHALKYTVLDLNYGISDSYSFKNWLKIVPLIEYRGLKYSLNHLSNDRALNQFDQSYDFLLYRLDIRSRYQATYPTNNELWKIKGLRHIFEPSISINSIQSLDSIKLNAYTSNEASPSFLFSGPSISLMDYRNLDQINELFLTRLSLNNYFQTKRSSYGSRNIMELHLLADFYHKYENRNPNDTVSEKNALWLKFKMNPAPWLKFEISSRLKSQSLNLVENYTRLVLTSSLFWEFGLSSYSKEALVDQISFDLLYKFNNNTHLKSILWADLKNDTIHRFRLEIDKIYNTSWRTSYSINYRKDKRREDDLSFDIGLQLIAY